MSPRLSLLVGSVAGEFVTEGGGRKEAGGGAVAFITPIGYCVVAGESAFLNSLAWSMLILGLTFAISHLNHVLAWRVRREPKADVDPGDLICLDRLLYLQSAIALVWLTASVLLVLHPGATLPVLPQRIPCIALFTWAIIPAVVATVVTSNEKAQAAGLGFVTEAVRGSKPAKFLKRVTGPLEPVVMVKPLRNWLKNKEIGILSGFSIFLISTLLLFGGEAVYGIGIARGVSAGLHTLVGLEEGPSEPTYEELCPGLPVPGHPAPPPWSKALYGL